MMGGLREISVALLRGGATPLTAHRSPLTAHRRGPRRAPSAARRTASAAWRPCPATTTWPTRAAEAAVRVRAQDTRRREVCPVVRAALARDNVSLCTLLRPRLSLSLADSKTLDSCDSCTNRALAALLLGRGARGRGLWLSVFNMAALRQWRWTRSSVSPVSRLTVRLVSLPSVHPVPPLAAAGTTTVVPPPPPVVYSNFIYSQVLCQHSVYAGGGLICRWQWSLPLTLHVVPVA